MGRKTFFSFLPNGETLGEYERTGVPASPWSTLREYVWLDGRPVAQEEHPSAAERYTYAVHVNHIGQPRALTNLVGGVAQIAWAATATPYGDVEETTAVDRLSGKTVVTNLRLPGQYDERLLGSLGLQGPYYNWNRWYLPSVGRYLELDPIAKAGGFNGFYGPNWYGYAEGNPLRYTDVMGLDIDVCFSWFAAGNFGHVGFGSGGSGETEGFYPIDNPLDSDGVIKPDKQKPKQCKTLPSDKKGDECMKKCRDDRAADPGRYRLTSRQCTSFVRDCLRKCGLPAGTDNGPFPEPFFFGLPGDARVQ